MATSKNVRKTSSVKRKKPTVGRFGSRRSLFSGRNLLLVALLFGVIGSVILYLVHAQTPNDPPVTYSDNTILLRYKNNVPENAKSALLNRYKGNVTDEIPQIKTKVITVAPEALDAVIEALSHNPAVEVAEKNVSRDPSDLTPNDPCYSRTSVGYVSSECYSGKFALPFTQTQKAWDTTTGSATVAVVDSGISATHPDLAANLVPGYNVLDKSANTNDTAGHGTEVAGNVAEVGNNQTGSVGYCFTCKLMPIKATTGGSAYDSNLAAGVIWAADHGARVINLSFAGTATSSTLASAISYARQHNATVVAAAGNSGTNTTTYPAGYPGVLSVGATSNSSGEPLQGYSNYGTWVKLAAPAGEITTTLTGYAPIGGTSLASPVIAAIAGLLVSAKPDASATAIEQALLNNTDPCCGNQIGGGRVNAYKAMQALLGATATPPPSPTDSTAPSVAISSPVNGTTVSGQTSVTINASDNVAVSKVELYRNNVLVGSESVAPYGFFWDTTSVANGSYTFTAKAYDAAGNVASSTSVTLTVNNITVTDTTSPIVSITSPANNTRVGNSVNVAASASDNIKVVSMEVYLDGTLRASSTSGSISANKLNTRKLSTGNHTITVRAYDAAGNVGTASVVIVK